MKHIKGPVLDWIKKKRPAIETAQAEYIKIVELKPTPPPAWVIAAGSQVGGLWGNFVREFRAAPIPKDIKKDTELRNAYYGGLDEASEPDKLRAKAAFRDVPQVLGHLPVLRRVLAQMRALAVEGLQDEYHAIDEFRASPTNIGSGLNDRPYPLEIGGQPYTSLAAAAAAVTKKDSDDDKPKKGGGGKKAGGPPAGKKGTMGVMPGGKKR